MIYTKMTKKAIKLMFEKHNGQVDKAGMPYVLHPLHVAEKMKDEVTTTVALLHDIVEDTNITFEQLEDLGFPKVVIDALKCLTHESNVEYFDYIKKIGVNQIATVVKIADLEHNSDLSRLEEIKESDLLRVEKYSKCLKYLKEVEKMRSSEIIKNANVFQREQTGREKKDMEKLKAGIVGFVVGDALGVPIEFSDRQYLEKRPLKEMVGYGSHKVPEGTWSDDTSMMLATMDSIVEKDGLDYWDIMYKFSEWTDYAKYTATDVLFDIGISTSRAISNFKKGTDVLSCGGRGFKDNGNGSLMRILPIVYYLNFANLSEEEEIMIINNVSSLTHGHEISCLGCKIFSDYVTAIINGADKSEALTFVKNQNYDKYYSSDAILAYKRILNGKLEELSKNEIRSSGYVVDTLEASLWCTLNSDNYEQSVVTAINLGEDTDTIGAITGSINGIVYGMEQIPDRWLNKLRKKDYLFNLIERFTNELYCDKKEQYGIR